MTCPDCHIAYYFCETCPFCEIDRIHHEASKYEVLPWKNPSTTLDRLIEEAKDKIFLKSCNINMKGENSYEDQ